MKQPIIGPAPLMSKNLDKLAEQDKEKNEQRDLETKLLIGKFIGTCKQYFFDVHIHRNILPTDYKKVNHTVQDLLEVYEEYLPYIMRNPDYKFGLIYLVIMPTRQLDINIRIKDILNITINLYQTEINRINDFLECITTSWRDFKKEHQAEQEQLQSKNDCPQGRNNYQCVKSVGGCLDPQCPERIKPIFSGRSGVRTYGKDKND
jgi:hypothetical protein